MIPNSAPQLITTKLLVLAPGRAPRLFERDIPAAPTQTEIAAIIEPLIGLEPMEHVAVLIDGSPTDMFVDAHSAVKGMPRNDEATRVYRNAWLALHPETDPERLPAIYGPAVISMRRIWQ